MNQQNSILEDGDLLYTILANLKRTSREYTTATTESNCPIVREKFQELLHDSLLIQKDVYTFMAQQGMYNTSSSALFSEVTKQLNQYKQTQTQTNQFIQKNLN